MTPRLSQLGHALAAIFLKMDSRTYAKRNSPITHALDKIP
jgi:hypothetical protein